MAIQKKHGKGRLDKWYRLAKEKGYRARSAFKLVQLNKRYNFLEKSKVLIDLCAAPGGWCQVAAEVMPANSLIIGVDLAPIKPIPRCITFQSDITSDHCRTTIRQHLKTWKADTVIHDGAPNVGAAWVQDAYSQAELVLESLKLATMFLVEGGTFVSKVFRSKDYNPLLWVFKQLFNKVEATKPPSSRNVSAEIFVVCRGYKAPKNLDPKFLDPHHVFQELSAPTPNHEAKVFNPEKKKRKREGYEEGDYTQFKEVPAIDFIKTTDPIAMLATINKFSLEKSKDGDTGQDTLSEMHQTTDDVRNSCLDLKVLGRKEFKVLLRWRLKVRNAFGLSVKKENEEEVKEAEPEKGEEVTEVSAMDDELRIQEELQRLRDKDNLAKRKQRKKENEKKRKEIVRTQLNMTAPMDIGMEQTGPLGEGAFFDLKTVSEGGLSKQLSKGKMHIVLPAENKGPHRDVEEDEEDSDSDADNLERELDNFYETYQERKSDADAKFRAKKARKQYEHDEWDGFSDGEGTKEGDDGNNSDELVEEDDSDDEISDSDDDAEAAARVTDLDNTKPRADGLSKKAAAFFEQDMFKDLGIPGLDKDVESESDTAAEDVDKAEKEVDSDPGSDVVDTGSEGTMESGSEGEQESESDSDEDSFEVVRADRSEWDDEHVDPTTKRTKIDIVTAEAMTIAQQLASGQKTKAHLEDESFNKYAYRDTEGLPEWFIDDEGKHSTPHRPITKEAASAIKEKLRALNARPIKKVREAKNRKKFRANQRVEKLKKKSALLLEDENVSEKDKANEIQRIMAKAMKKKPKSQVKVIVARGRNKGQGRPKGVKGRYKMVDSRMKKEVRALKRIEKKSKSKKR